MAVYAKNFVVSSRRGSVWVGCVLFPAYGGGGVRCGSPLSQFSDWDRLVLSRGELGCRS